MEFYFLYDGKINLGEKRKCDRCKVTCAVNACEVIECGSDWVKLYTRPVEIDYCSVEDYTDQWAAVCIKCWDEIKSDFDLD